MTPLVSIGLPVFNGEQYIEIAIKSILAQTYHNFELIISDNASTDKTAEICEKYALQDSRIIFQRQAENIGASRNHNYTFEIAKGKYFKWAAHDDLIAPDFIEKCVAVLEREPEVLLCFSKVRVIDQEGSELGDFGFGLKESLSTKIRNRFGELLFSDIWNVELFGLIRTEKLRETSLFPSYIASDRILRAHLGILGKFYEIPEYLFFSRDHPGRSTRAFPAHHQRAKWFDTKNSEWVLPHCRIFIEYAKLVRDVDISWVEKMHCYKYVFLWLFKRFNILRLAADFVILFFPFSWKILDKLSGSSKNWLVIKKTK